MSGYRAAPATHTAVAEALNDCRRAFWSVAVFSGGVNLLMLAGPLYMLQIYDRVLSSRSVPTLVALTVCLIVAYAFQGALDVVRTRIVVRAATLLDRRLETTVHGAMLRIATRSANAKDAMQPVRDLDQIRTFLTGTGPIAIVDLPWMPVFLAICFLLHPWVGFASLAGVFILFGLAIQTERASRALSRTFAQQGGVRQAMVEADRRNGESIVAMGMADALANRWAATNKSYLQAVGSSTDVTSTYGSISKAFRFFLQSSILGIGAYLVIRGEMTAGTMIAASIMMGRALAPIETLIANWRYFIAARQSIRRLSEILARIGPDRTVTELPRPTRSVEVEQLAVAAPGVQRVIVGDVQFSLAAGEALGVIGPSGAGKTSLVRALVGIWPPARGSIRIDGARLDQWDPISLGGYIGFVSQEIGLFDGTIAENIARMSPQPDSEAVLEAARAAGAHEMILRMPSGYDTQIGDGGAALSGGQRQRIALARALYGNPFLLVLDEAGSNLDKDGETALLAAIEAAKARGSIVIMVAHRPSALACCDKVLWLANGVQQAYGPRDETLRKILVPRQPQPAPAASNLKVVREAASGAE